jgi:1-acyl-sn-glycerol-3-phosphate acyltransferase
MAYEGLRQIFGPLINSKIKEVGGLEHLLDHPPFIVAANHVGFLDAPIIIMTMLSRQERLVHYLTDRLMWWLWGGPIARRWLGMIMVHTYNERRRAESLSEAITVLERGGTVGIFPEAWRNSDPHTLLPGKTGAVRLALASGVPIIPVGLVNTTGKTLGEAACGVFRKNTYATLKIGEPVDLAEFKNKPIDKPLLVAATRKLMKAIGALCNKEYPH